MCTNEISDRAIRMTQMQSQYSISGIRDKGAKEDREEDISGTGEKSQGKHRSAASASAVQGTNGKSRLAFLPSCLVSSNLWSFKACHCKCY